MPRIRTIKPEFFGSPSHRYADPWVRLFYVSMWNWADDTGRGTANPRELAAFAFPDDEDPTVPTVDDVPRLLLEVHKRYDVTFYKVDGRRYYEIPPEKWNKHQRNERKAASRYPGPEGGAPYDPGPGDGGSFTESRNFRDRATEAPGETHGRVAGESFGSDDGGTTRLHAEDLTDGAEDSPPDAREQGVSGVPPECHGNTVGDDGASALGTGEPGTGERRENRVDAGPERDEPCARADVDHLCQLLADLVVANGSKRPSITKDWRRDARLLLDKERRDPDEVERLIRWAQGNRFWRPNIRSMPKFRTQYDTLRLQAAEDPRWRLAAPHDSADALTDAEIKAIVQPPWRDYETPPEEIENDPDRRKAWYDDQVQQRRTQYADQARHLLETTQEARTILARLRRTS